MALIKKLSGAVLGASILINGFIIGDSASAASTNELQIPAKFIEKVAKESNKSVTEVEDLLKESKKEYDKTVQDLEKIDEDKKIKFKQQVDKMEKESGKSKNEAVETILPKLKGKNYTYDSTTGNITINDGNANVNTLASSSALGTYGDVLVTLDGGSGSSFGVWGHAAIVSDYSDNFTVESFLGGLSPQVPNIDGVFWHSNDWKTRYANPHAYMINYIDVLDYNKAAQYAEIQVNEPYSLNFSDKWATNKWYCSQLVWRAWYNRGTNLDYNGGNEVWPGDIVNDSDTYQYY